MEKPAGHFQTLDALRGIAAIAVMVFHAPGVGARVLPGGYLAVDLFFMLSGAVIAHAYAARMADGMRARAFLARRAIRLWPMLALGALLGIVLHGGHAGSLFLLPNWKSSGSLFPANPPLWSLLMEALAYGAFALGLWRVRPRMLGAYLVLAGSALVGLTLTSPYLPIDFGAHWPTFATGIIRVGFGFGMGMLMWQQWQKRGCPSITGNRAWLLALAILCVMAAATQTDRIAALAAVLIAFPAITWMALRWEVPQARVAKVLGDLSYPLYCVHLPILMWASGGRPVSIALCFLLPLAALAAERWIDRPARRWLATQAKPKATDQTRIGIST